MAGDYSCVDVLQAGETHFAPAGVWDNMFNLARFAGEIKRTVSPVISYLT
jgi:hypothetical protein